MYTVLRFNLPDEMNIDDSTVLQLGQLIHKSEFTAYDGKPDHCGGRISFEIANCKEWEMHLKDIISSINTLAEVIDFANSSNIDIEIDIAFYSSDLTDDSIGFTWEFPCSFLKTITDKKITLAHTYYDDRD